MSNYHKTADWLAWMDELATNDYVIIDPFLHDVLYSQVKSYFLSKLPDFKQAGIGTHDLHTIHREIRGDHTFWLDRNIDHTLVEFWALIEETIRMFNRFCFLSLSGFEFHFANYPPGGHYARHVDQFQNRNNRMISFILYLNDAWKKGDGGELEIFLENGESILVEPTGGKCVMFKSADVPHAVLESAKNRYSLTGWLLYKPPALAPLFG